VPTRRIPNPLDGEQPLKAETKRDPMAKERAALSASSQQPSDAQVLDDSLLDNETAASGSERAADPADSGPEGRFSDCERRINAGDYLGARNLYRVMLRKDPDDAAAKAGVELSEGLKALAEGDRLEAAQRFEVVLDLDPSNERAARELAEMRRHATNQRKGLLTRLLGQRDKK
jgi:predicted TPR repeat methyltransferase